MKRSYKRPIAEKIAFKYEEQIAAASGQCDQAWTLMTTLDPGLTCVKCTESNIWLGLLG